MRCCCCAATASLSSAATLLLVQLPPHVARTLATHGRGEVLDVEMAHGETLLRRLRAAEAHLHGARNQIPRVCVTPLPQRRKQLLCGHLQWGLEARSEDQNKMIDVGAKGVHRERKKKTFFFCVFCVLYP